MRLITLGSLRLEESNFSRPKPLLLLTYLTLEGPQARRKLADLFWNTPANTSPKKGLAKLSVVLTQFKKENASSALSQQPGADPLQSHVPCDALEFVAAFEAGRFADAVGLYGGVFLEGFDDVLGSLGLSDALLDWVLLKREFLAERVRTAMLRVAETAFEARELSVAALWAEKAFAVAGAPALEAAEFSRLQHLLRAGKGEASRLLDRAVRANLADVSGTAREVFLALSLQRNAHLAAIRDALKVSISELARVQEELILSGLVSADLTVLAADMAADYLARHPAERLPLLMKLARSSAPQDAFGLYQRIYRETKAFGGIGDVTKARQAYLLHATELMNAAHYDKVSTVLAELREVEARYELASDTRCCFLEAYALERLGRFKDALALLQALPESERNPDVTALMSGLLWRTGKPEDARLQAEKALSSDHTWLWAKATANNTLGYLAYSSERLLDAASHFKKAASFFQAANETDRYAGSLNNYANALDMMSVFAEREGKDAATVHRMRKDAESAYFTALNALTPDTKNNAQKARIYLNLGTVWESAKDYPKAETYYLQALKLANDLPELEIKARLELNLGTIYTMMAQPNDATKHYSNAIRHATQAGEYAVQSVATANLAKLNNDPDGLESALELLEQGGQLEQYPFFLDDYEGLLRVKLEEALRENDTRKAQRFFMKLGRLFAKKQDSVRMSKVDDALLALEHMTRPSEHKDMLLALLGVSDTGNADVTGVQQGE